MAGVTQSPVGGAVKFVLIVCDLVIIGWFVTNAVVVIFLLWRSRTSKKGKRDGRGQSMQIDSAEHSA